MSTDDTVKSVVGGTAGQGAGGGGHPREVLRRGLQQLSALSAELSAEERRLEAQRVKGAEAEGQRAEKERWDAEERARKRRLAVEAESVAATDAAEAEHARAEAEARDVRARVVRKAKDTHGEQVSQIKKAVSEGEWLADSLLEGAEAAAAKGRVEAQRALTRAVEAVDEKQAEAIAALEKYGQQHLILDPPPSASPETGAIDAMEERHAEAKVKTCMEKLSADLEALRSSELANAMVGFRPYLIGLFVVAAGAGAGQLTTLSAVVDPLRAGIGAGVGGLLAAAGGVWAQAAANRRVRALLVPVRQGLEDARAWAEAVAKLTERRIEADLRAARARREDEVQAVRDRHRPVAEKVDAQLKSALAAAEQEATARLAAAKANREKSLALAAATKQKSTDELEARLSAELETARTSGAKRVADADAAVEAARAALVARWREGLESVAAATRTGAAAAGTAVIDWESMDFTKWPTPQTFPAGIRFGGLRVDVAALVGGEEEGTQGNAGTEALRHGGTEGEEGTEENAGKVGGAGWWRIGGVLEERFEVPAMLAFGEGAASRASSLMLEFGANGGSGRGEAIAALRATTARLLATMPAGRVRLTMVDPVALGQTFAGFMHLADYDEQLTGPRIWTDQEAIDKRLSDLTDHMETVIQKYLRNEFETIDAYNAQAGELAEPYRLLVVADFPTGFSAEALRKLQSILSAGAKCGVHVLLARDTRVSLERRVLEDVRAGVTVVGVGEEGTEARMNVGGHGGTEGKARGGSVKGWHDEVFGGFELVLDSPPSEEKLTELCRAVGEGARRANRVEVDFRACLPAASERWGGSTASEFRVPVGRSGATRLQMLKLGKGVAQHALLAGKTGSGKSTLLHVMVTASALWFSPGEVEFYLIDFKKGVEFKAYADGKLPHCRAVAIESDREFGVSVLQRLDAELTRRGEMFRAAGVQDLAGYREAVGLEGAGGTGTEARRHGGTEGKAQVPAPPPSSTSVPQCLSASVPASPSASVPLLPRVLLVVDEFQEFFSEDDRLAQEASGLLDRLVRQGRAFGMHVILGSQTIGGSTSLPRATLGQMAVRVALQCSEADSTMILGDANTAARLLTRPGEAIYNDNGGLPEANSPFQVAWLPDEKRDGLLAEVSEEAQKRGWTYDAVVFEGNKPVDFATHRGAQEVLTSGGAIPTAVLGEPVAIRPATRVLLRRQPGANVLMIGQQEDAAMASMQAAVLTLAASSPAGRFVVMEGTMAESPLRGLLSGLRPAPPPPGRSGSAAPPHDAPTTDGAPGPGARVEVIEYRDVDAALGRLHEELQKRLGEPDSVWPETFVLIYGLQRYRTLRKSGDDYSFSMSDEPKKLSADKQLAELAREGPAVGMHVIAWADTLTSVERVFDRGLMREFDHRVLFQMSAADSSSLIDSPAANKLGPFRALLFSEEQGVMEKFRPFAPVSSH